MWLSCVITANIFICSSIVFSRSNLMHRFLSGEIQPVEDSVALPSYCAVGLLPLYIKKSVLMV